MFFVVHIFPVKQQKLLLTPNNKRELLENRTAFEVEKRKAPIDRLVVRREENFQSQKKIDL